MIEKGKMIRVSLFNDLDEGDLFIAHNNVNVKISYSGAAKTLWSENFFSQNIDPIDAIIVPLHEDHPNL